MMDINNSQVLDSDTEKELMALYGCSPLQEALLSYGPPSIIQRMNFLAAKRHFGEYGGKLTDPIPYYLTNIKDQQGNVKPIWRFIATHPDMDHLAGLARLQEELVAGRIPAMHNFWDTNHSFGKDNFEAGKYDEKDWDEYQAIRGGARGANILRLHRRSTGNYWTDDGIEILGPSPALEKKAGEQGKPNLFSYVLKITYGGCVVILGGDALSESWQEIHDYYMNTSEVPVGWLSADILKASHHGRDAGYHQEAVALINPQYTIISVGKKPESDATGKYRGYTSKKVLSTRQYGNIVVKLFPTGKFRVIRQYPDGLY